MHLVWERKDLIVRQLKHAADAPAPLGEEFFVSGADDLGQLAAKLLVDGANRGLVLSLAVGFGRLARSTDFLGGSHFGRFTSAFRLGSRGFQNSMRDLVKCHI
jgi:hypothetical protein